MQDGNPAPAERASSSKPPSKWVVPGVSCADATDTAFGFALRLLGDRQWHLAEDIAQESVLALSTYAKQNQVGCWKSLLYKTVQNKVRTAYARAKNARARDKAAARPDRSPSLGPFEEAELADTAAYLARLMDQLDEQFGAGTRAIVDLRARGVQWDQVAELVRMKNRTCGLRYSKAVQWLEDRLSLQRVKGGEHA